MGLAAKLAAVFWLVGGSIFQFGDVGTTVIQAIICGSVPSAPVILAPADGTNTTNPSITVSGIAGPSTPIVLYDGSANIGSTTSAPDGSYSLSAALTLGANPLHTEATTSCGTSPPSNTVNVTRVAVPPGAPTITSPASNTTTIASSTVVSGSAEPNSTVTVSVNGVVVGSVGADSYGAFSISVGLGMGNNTLTATATNGAGQGPPSAPVVVTRVQAPPEPNNPGGGGNSGIVAPPGSPVSPTIAIISPTNGFTTDKPQVTVVGVGPANQRVAVVLNGVEVAHTMTDSSGRFQLDVALPLGSSSLQAQFASGSSEVVTVTRMLGPPLPPKILNPHVGQVVTNSHITVEGLAEPGAMVAIFIDGREVGRVKADDRGYLSLSVQLHNGRNNLTAVATTSGGSTSSNITDVYYQPAGGLGLLDRLMSWLVHSTVGVFVAVIVFAAASLHALADSLIASLSHSFGGVALIVAVSVLGGAVLHGPAGLATARMLPLLILVRRRRYRPEDAVTGRPLTITASHADGNRLVVYKPGYQDGSYQGSDPYPSVRLQPQLLYDTSLQYLLVDVLRVVGWLSIWFGLEAAWWWASHGQLVAGYGFGAIMVQVGMVQLVVGWSLPKTRWGKVVDGDDGALPNAQIELYRAETNELLMSTTSDDTGHFALYGAPGRYVIRVKAGSVMSTTLVNRRFSSGYLTPRIVLGAPTSVPGTRPQGTVQ